MIHKGYMMPHHQTDIPKFFEKKFWEWQAGERKTQKEFAEYLGVAPGTLSHWMNGVRSPDYESCLSLYEKLGYEIFDVSGFLRPDPQLKRIISMWDKMDSRGKSVVIRSITEAINQDKTEQTDYGSESTLPDQ
jgi:transcriptional regulator with XRE-family HTH domain